MQKKILLSAILGFLVLGLTGTLENAFAEEVNLSLLDRFNPTAPGEVQSSIGAVFVDEAGTMYVTTTHPKSGISVYDSDNSLIRFIDAQTSEINEFSGLNALAVGNDGTIYLGETGGQRVLILDSVGNLIHIIDKTESEFGTKGLGIVNAVEISDDGILYVHAFNDVQSFDSDFNLIAEFSNSDGIIDLDEFGNVQVYNRFSETMTTFDSTGNVLDTVSIPTPPGHVTFTELETDENNNIILMNRFSEDSCLFMFDPTRILLQTFCSGTEDEFGFYDFDFMLEMSQGDDDRIYVVDRNEILELTFDNVWCGVLEENFDNVFVGTSGDDNIKGTSGNDVLVGLDGSDTLVGKAGNDCILGGNGDDVISGNDGKISFDIDSENSPSLISEINSMLEEKSFARVTDVTGTYSAIVSSQEKSIGIEYRLVIKPTIQNHFIEDSQTLDSQWRGFLLENPIIVDSIYGEYDINSPSSILKITSLDSLDYLQGTSAVEILKTLLIDTSGISEFSLSMWESMFDPTAKMSETENFGFTGSVITNYSMGICTVYLGLCEDNTVTESFAVGDEQYSIRSVESQDDATIVLEGYM